MVFSFGASRLAGLLLPAAACALRMVEQGNPEGASTDIAGATGLDLYYQKLKSVSGKQFRSFLMILLKY